MIKYQIFYQQIPTEKIEEVKSLYATIFEIENFDKFYQRIDNQKDILWQLAYDENLLVGYKIGYKTSETVFYSWIGGVLLEYRGQKIAHDLMLQQHKWCEENGIKIIQTKTLNRWKNMLILNLRHGFDIVSIYTDEKNILKIILEKVL